MSRRAALVPALAAALLLGGCASDSFELNAPGLHISSSAKRQDAKVPDRAPLLIPPDRSRLPEPQQASVAAAPQNWPNDPDAVAKAEEAEAARKEEEYKEKGKWGKEANIDEFNKLMDPMSRREPGYLNRWLGGQKKEKVNPYEGER